MTSERRNEASLVVGTVTHKGWTDLSVSRSMESLAASFDVLFTERWSEKEEPIPIRKGDKCRMNLDGETVVKGYIDSVPRGYDATQHGLRASGRALGDLVDCSSIYKKGRWKNQGLLTIAKNLCEPFSIEVSTEVSLGEPFETFAIQDGESVFETLERACRMRGVIMQATPENALVFVNVGRYTTRTVLEFGKNILSANAESSDVDRYSEYILKTQARGTDGSYGKNVAHPRSRVEDKGITRYRPLVVHADSQGTSTGLKTRATWEMNVRAGRSERVTYRVAGWYCEEGLWKPNTLVQVRDPYIEINGELLIVGVTNTKGEQGTFTDLELCRKEAMTLEPLVSKPKGKKTSFHKGTS